jgi:DNA (cytosine-5)-methyltransferase 1
VPYRTTRYREPVSPVGTVGELFAGVGGFRIGLAKAGWQTVFSNQWEPATAVQHASAVYEARFGPAGHTNKDIARINKLPQKVDLVVGGFPCQDYSVAKTKNAASGLEGKKGVLWWEILRILTKHKPKWVFLENVDRLLKSPSTQPGRDFAVMLSSLDAIGYEVEWRAVNAADYGFPQRRIRVFIIASRRSRRKANPDDLILSEGVLARALPVSTNQLVHDFFEIDSDLLKVSKTFNQGGRKSPFLNSGFFSRGVAYTTKTVAVYRGKRMTLGDVLVADGEVPDDYWIDDADLKKWEFLKGSKRVPRTDKKTGFSYFYSEGKMTFPDALDRPSRTILTAEGGATPSRFKHIIRTKRGFRRLTPLELERLCGFPDNWTNPPKLVSPMTDSKRAFFMGNALVVGLIERVGRELAFRMAQE